MAAAVVAGTVLVAMAAPAWAHVTVDPESVPQGASDATLTFRVPNEGPAADTTKVDIQFPTDHPIAVLTPAAENGWTPTVTMQHLDTPITTDDGSISDVVSEIVWSGGKIAPGQFAEFRVLAQGVPSGVDSLKFPTVQTYSDGTVVSWIQVSPAGGPAADHPTPVLTLTAAANSSSSSAPSSSSSASSSSQVAAPATQTVKNETNNGLAIAAIALAAVALLTALAGLARKRAQSQS